MVYTQTANTVAERSRDHKVK